MQKRAQRENLLRRQGIQLFYGTQFFDRRPITQKSRLDGIAGPPIVQ